MNLEVKYNRQNPCTVSIKDRYTLCGFGSSKDTRHVVIDIKDTGFEYVVGDSLAILPINDPHLVERTLKALKCTGNEIVHDKKGTFYPLHEYLRRHANLKGLSKKFLTELASRISDRASLDELLKDENKEALKEWLASHELWDLLERYPEAELTVQEFVDLAMPLLPRFYSIASSQAATPDEIHLTVAFVRYETRGIPRMGVCTHYLCELAPLNESNISVYLQPGHDFRLPQPETPIIMIGPGTGVAPFRAFMQEREHRGHSGKNWLFFGEWTRTSEFFYEQEWDRWQKMGLLDYDLAFSRDQEHKIYVQHLMLEKGKELYKWLEEGATLYVCGDAHRMAKDVDATLHQILEQHGGMSHDEAHAFIKHLKKEKRYLRDVY